MSGKYAGLALLLVLAGCESGALNNQTLGRTTGLFSQIPSANASCEMLSIGGVSMDVTFFFYPEGPNAQKDTLDLSLTPLGTADQRFVLRTSMQYGFGDSASALVELERGHERVDPELTPDVAKQAAELRTNMYFPVYLHRVKVTGAHLCNADPSTGVPNPDDCLDVPDSTIDEAQLWCIIGEGVGQEWTK